MNKILVVLLLTFSCPVWTQIAPTTSCSMSIRRGNHTFWYCDDGVYDINDTTNERVKIDTDQWNNIQSDLRADFDSNPIKKLRRRLAFAKDSCSLGFTHGEHKYMRCDEGFYEQVDGIYKRISSTRWNAAAQGLNIGIEYIPVPVGLEGCTKSGFVIECPDGTYRKDLGTSSESEIFKHVETGSSWRERPVSGSQK